MHDQTPATKGECCPENLSRRDFMKTIPSAAAFGSLTLSQFGCENSKMKYVTLGRSGIKASVFLGDQMTDVKMYEAALASGVNYWHKIGHWAEPAPYELFRKIPRDAFCCDTTVGSLDKNKAIEIFERSLQKTGLEYIDGFKIHSQYRSPKDFKEKTGAIEAFEQLKKQGKTRILMMSQHVNTAEIFEAAVESDLFDVIQVPVNPIVPMDYFTKEKFTYKPPRDRYLATIKKAADKNIGVTAMKVFLGSRDTWKEVPNLKEEVSRYLPTDGDIANALIHWSLAVPGVKAFGNLLYSFEELKSNIEAIGGELTDAEDAGLKKFSECAGGYLCRFCGACERANPGKVAVSDILRFSMYHTGYRQSRQARAMYARLPKHARVEAASDLRPYEKACPYGLPVAHLLQKAKQRLG
jgi:predicted aldo/keto reductase-like oxidoreductase